MYYLFSPNGKLVKIVDRERIATELLETYAKAEVDTTSPRMAFIDENAKILEISNWISREAQAVPLRRRLGGNPRIYIGGINIENLKSIDINNKLRF